MPHQAPTGLLLGAEQRVGDGGSEAVGGHIGVSFRIGVLSRYPASGLSAGIGVRGRAMRPERVAVWVGRGGTRRPIGAPALGAHHVHAVDRGPSVRVATDPVDDRHVDAQGAQAVWATISLAGAALGHPGEVSSSTRIPLTPWPRTSL